jgi:23S rRNA (cytosine1962-C5)-methyltransferase
VENVDRSFSVGEQGVWENRAKSLEPWTVQHGTVTFELKPTPFGHVGLFPEQAENWDWIAEQVRRARRPLKVLNLFAYTGGSTLAAAAAGAEVVHVDAAKNVVEWARRNALHSHLAEAPIRWIAEDARKFVQRELRRGNRYDAVILDPPSYGHGTGGEAWKLERDLLPLLAGCGELTADSRAFMLLTCHSPNFGAAELQAAMADAVFGTCQCGAIAKPLFLRTEDGRKLSAGVAARWPR